MRNETVGAVTHTHTHTHTHTQVSNNNEKIDRRNDNGVTLIALVITIIILLILASVSITTLFGETGIITKAQEAGRKTEEAARNEQEILNYAKEYINEILNPTETWENVPIATKFENDNTGEIKIGDYVVYNPTPVILTNTSDIIVKLGTYSGNPNSEYNKADSTNSISQEITLKWRVLDKLPSGEIRLISEEPTASVIRLGGADGYNNAVNLIDDFCSGLYYNTSLVSNVQGLKIEDIEEKMNLSTWDYHSYIDNYQYENYAEELSTYKNYPSIFYNEKGQKVNDEMHGNIGLSEQEIYISEGAITTATSIQPKQTYWGKDFGTTNNSQFTQDMYHELFIRKIGITYLPYWLSSRCVSPDYEYTEATYFEVRKVDSGKVNAHFLYYSRGGSWAHNAYSLRPIVTLKSSVQVIGGDAVSGWIIESNNL